MSTDFDKRLSVDRIYGSAPTIQKPMIARDELFQNEKVEVLQVIDTKITKDCQRHYLVSFRAWSPEERLHGYEQLIGQFWKTQTTEGWDESHSDKENKYLPEENLTNGRKSPSYELYHKHSPQYEQNGDVNNDDDDSYQGDEQNGDVNNDDDSYQGDEQNGVVNNGDNDSFQGDEQNGDVNNDDDDSFQDNGQTGDLSDREKYSNIHDVGEIEKEIVEKETVLVMKSDEEQIPNNIVQAEHEHVKDDEDKTSNEHSTSWSDQDMSHEYIATHNGLDNQEDSHESIEKFDSSETIDISLENNLEAGKEIGENCEDDETSTRPASSYSDKTISSISSLSDKPKKRKLKTLDDIVRKISGTTDQPCEKKQTLDETLSEHSKEEVDVVNDETLETSPSEQDKSIIQANKEYNIYWSAGKASFQKPVRAFRCFPCDQLFEFDYELRDHQRVVHGEETPNVENRISPTADKITNDARKRASPVELRGYNCRQCGKGFNSLSLLDRHRYEVHKARRRYEKCSYCSTMYSDPVLLRRHELSHFRGYDLYRPGDNGVPFPIAQSEERSFEGYPKEHNGQNEHTAFNGREQHSPFKTREERAPVIVREEHGPFNGREQRTFCNGREERLRGSNGQYYEEENSSFIKNPIRNLLGKMHYSQPVSRDQGSRDPIKQEDLNGEKVHPLARRDVISKDSIPFRYARFMQEQHGFPPDRSPPPEQSPTGMPVKNGEEREKKEGFQEFIRICPVCKKTFPQKEAFDHHWLTAHNDQNIFNCDTCKRTFFKEDEFNSHMTQHRAGFICNFCGQAFDSNVSLEAHMRIHSSQERPFQCHICGRRFSLKTNLRRHMMLHTEAMLVFRCQLCSKGMKSEEQLNKHLQEFHGRFLVVDDKRVDIPSAPVDDRYMAERQRNGGPPSPIYHQQPHRDRNLRNGEHYIDDSAIRPYEKTQTEHLSPRHLPALHPKMNMDSKIPSVRTSPHYSPVKPSPPIHIMPAPSHCIPRLMKCHECNEEFTSKSLYEIHLQSHVKEIFSCPKCTKTFTKRTLFDSHLLSHENNKSHNCPYCHRSFSMKGNLRRHIRIHTNEAPYECPICFQRFRRSDGLKGHIKRHETMGESAPTDMVPSQASAQTSM